MPRFNRLAEWLQWQESLHPRSIDLGLDRVARVAQRMELRQPGPFTITVAGTNGKGSSIAMLEAMLLRAGYSVCSYTSPHLLRYNERIRINGTEVSDTELCSAFDAVDTRRHQDSLTCFEFGTLAALGIIQDRAPDISLLEVGLGGRLDAVNIIDPDIALVTAIGIDHVVWLGNSRAAIAREKAGIFRSSVPAVSSDPDPVDSLGEAARKTGARWYGLNEQYHYVINTKDWNWTGPCTQHDSLPVPVLPGDYQFDNAAGVLMVLELIRERYPVDRGSIDSGLQEVRLPGRCQFTGGAPETVLDVAHNPQGARGLVAVLRNRPVTGNTWVVLGMLEDKDVAGFTEYLAPVADHWCLAGLEAERGLTAAALGARVSDAINPAVIACFPDVTAALGHASRAAGTGDRVVVCGSFHTVAEAMAGTV
ncbi:MAG: bifunctional tetrahydrofolate synthase/dihydrofolate synthase [Thiohalobacterales bacterium]